jgi:deoxyribose-phosphate aldolase
MKIRGEEVTEKWFASKLEHFIAGPVNKEKIDKLVDNAVRYGFRTLAFFDSNAYDYAYERLTGTGIRLGTVFDFQGDASLKTRAVMAADAYKRGVRAADTMMDLSAIVAKNYKAAVQSIKVILDNVGPDFEAKVFTFCNEDSDLMYAMADCLQEAGASHCKAYDRNGWGVNMNRIRELRAYLTKAQLKASGNGKYWSGAIAMGAFAAGADCISASNAPQIADELAAVKEVYSNITF